MPSQCPFVETRYAIDPNTFEIFHNYNCVKPEGHSGKHSFHTNPKFFKEWRTVKAEQQKILAKLEVLKNQSESVRV